MRQRKENELASQRKTVAAASRLHQARMDDMKLSHDAEMARMQRSNNENTKACNSAMATMTANAQQRMEQNMAEHNASISAMRRANDGAKSEAQRARECLEIGQRAESDEYGTAAPRAVRGSEAKAAHWRSGALSAHENADLQPRRDGERCAQPQRRRFGGAAQRHKGETTGAAAQSRRGEAEAPQKHRGR